MENSVSNIITSSIVLREPVSYWQLVTSAYSNQEVGMLSKIAEYF